MNIELILIIFFLFIIINHILTTNIFPQVERVIEGMTCNPNEQSKKSACFEKKMEENKTIVSTMEDSISTLSKNIKDLIAQNDGHKKKIEETQANIRKIKNSQEGRAVDNSGACEKHPQAC